MKRAAAEEAPEASKKQAVNPKAVGDLSHYRVDWSMQTCGEDYHMGGYDFKRSNVKGKLMFTYSEDGYEEDGTQVGFIEVTQYRMGYIENNHVDKPTLFDETQEAHELYERIVKKQEDELLEGGDLQLVNRMEVDPAHRGHGLGLFMIEAADHVLNGHMSSQVIKPFPLQFEGGDFGFPPPPAEAGEERRRALAAARAKISAYYDRIGFTQVDGTEFMHRSNIYQSPPLRVAMDTVKYPPLSYTLPDYYKYN